MSNRPPATGIVSIDGLLIPGHPPASRSLDVSAAELDDPAPRARFIRARLEPVGFDRSSSGAVTLRRSESPVGRPSRQWVAVADGMRTDGVEVDAIVEVLRSLIRF